MSRPLWLGLALVLLSNAVVLAGVWYNRSGEPQALLTLSERELQPPYSGWLRGEENSVLRLNLAWRHPLDQTRPAWLDEAKLRALGFEPQALGRGSGRLLWLVLELDGPRYRQGLERARTELARRQTALLADPDNAQRRRARDAQQRELEQEEKVASRLLLVDIGTDPQALRQAWPDRQRQVLVAARVRPYRQADEARYGAHIELENPRISVPREYRQLFQDGRGGSRPSRPALQVEVAFGQRHEPWVLDVRQ